MPSINPEVTCHKLNVDRSAKPIIQRARRSTLMHVEVVEEKVDRLLEARAIREVNYLTWLSNTVVVKKKNECSKTLVLGLFALHPIAPHHHSIPAAWRAFSKAWRQLFLVQEVAKDWSSRSSEELGSVNRGSNAMAAAGPTGASTVSGDSAGEIRELDSNSNAYTSLQVWASGLWASASVFGESVLPEGISLQADIWETVISIEYIHPSMLKSVPGSPGTIASEGSDIPGRPSGASASHPALGPQPNFDPLPPVEDLQCPNPRERLTQAHVLRPLVQPNERLYPLDVNELNPTAVKIVNLEKQFKKAQGLNSIPDIEDGHTEAAVRLPDRFKMPYIDRFDGSGDPMVHIRLFLDVLKLMGLTKPQKLSLYGRTLSGVAATWYAKLEDKVKQD
ncbi:hypothetical protein HYC85_029310 [Camellia sinensis]|uniref:Retrotransposon gag domain-containing protein n=1 Tax=Camellia sinensis TaxID=4442 RepID=A0A7J7FXW1_CAMSI|nr:hypothetical protein HYC85_029310 [Camellia sinensis]